MRLKHIIISLLVGSCSLSASAIEKNLHMESRWQERTIHGVLFRLETQSDRMGPR